MKKRELIFFAALATFLSANAQEKQTWSLEDCINYALEKNDGTDLYVGFCGGTP